MNTHILKEIIVEKNEKKKTDLIIVNSIHHTSACICTTWTLLCQIICVLLLKIPKYNLWSLIPMTQNMTFWNSNTKRCCFKVGGKKKKSLIIIVSISYLLRNHILKMNTRQQIQARAKSVPTVQQNPLLSDKSRSGGRGCSSNAIKENLKMTAWSPGNDPDPTSRLSNNLFICVMPPTSPQWFTGSRK